MSAASRAHRKRQEKFFQNSCHSFPGRSGAAGWLFVARKDDKGARSVSLPWVEQLVCGARGAWFSVSGPGLCHEGGHAVFFPAAPPPLALRLCSVRIPLTGAFLFVSLLKSDAKKEPAAPPRDVRSGCPWGSSQAPPRPQAGGRRRRGAGCASRGRFSAQRPDPCPPCTGGPP